MLDKIVVWVANITMACVLVLLALPNPAQALSQNLAVELTGTAIIERVGNLQISPTRFETGLIDIGQSSTRSVTLEHTGSTDSPPVQINATSLMGAHASEFVTDFTGYVTLYPGDSLEVEVTFTPSIPGKKNAAVRLDIQDSDAPHVLLVEGQARYPLTSDLESTDKLLKLGQIVEGTAKKQNFTLSNTAVEADAPTIHILSATLTGDTPQAFSENIQNLSLAPGESETVEVTLQDNQPGFKSANLEIIHDGNNPALQIRIEGEVVEPAAIPVNFSDSVLKNTNTLQGPTSLQFGPDGLLYVTEMEGLIHVYDIDRKGKNNYTATKLDTINAIANTQNHNDDGSLNPTKKRLITGILVVGTAAKPIIYAHSGDWRWGGGPSGNDTNLDTNSGILHRLTKNGNNWTKHDLVRGLPRSEENHQGNGLVMKGNDLLLAVGGTTNQGVPSNNFAGMTETALSAAILEIDLQAIGNGPYDLPTLDDEDQPGANDNNDPFGGNNGKNQAMLVAGGPVQIYAPGFRNAYDLVVTEAGRLYATDNGPNAGWGNKPNNNCANTYSNGGSTFIDQLHYVANKGYYAGHPNPVRGDKKNTFNASNPQSPVEVAANPKECVYKQPGQDGSLTTFPASTNGITEYRASNFGKAMQGDLLLTGFDKAVYRIVLNGNGSKVTSKSKLAQGLGKSPLDVVAQDDDEVFPGTIWVVDHVSDEILVLEPADY